MKNFLNNILRWITIIGAIFGAICLTIFMFWPFVALVLIFCVLFWILVPVIGWILFSLLMIFIILYVLIGIFDNN